MKKRKAKRLIDVLPSRFCGQFDVKRDVWICGFDDGTEKRKSEEGRKSEKGKEKGAAKGAK